MKGGQLQLFHSVIPVSPELPGTHLEDLLPRLAPQHLVPVKPIHAQRLALRPHEAHQLVDAAPGRPGPLLIQPDHQHPVIQDGPGGRQGRSMGRPSVEKSRKRLEHCLLSIDPREGSAPEPAVTLLGFDSTRWRYFKHGMPTADAEALRDAIGTTNIGGSVIISGNK